MITCTKCGKQNPDAVRFCEKCGKKLQSDRQASTLGDEKNSRLERFQHKGIPTDSWLSIKRMLEAWGYVVVLSLVGAMCFIYKEWWPIYPTIAILAILAWVRRI